MNLRSHLMVSVIYSNRLTYFNIYKAPISVYDLILQIKTDVAVAVQALCNHSDFDITRQQSNIVQQQCWPLRIFSKSTLVCRNARLQPQRFMFFCSINTDNKAMRPGISKATSPNTHTPLQNTPSPAEQSVLSRSDGLAPNVCWVGVTVVLPDAAGKIDKHIRTPETSTDAQIWTQTHTQKQTEWLRLRKKIIVKWKRQSGVREKTDSCLAHTRSNPSQRKVQFIDHFLTLPTGKYHFPLHNNSRVEQRQQ